MARSDTENEEKVRLDKWLWAARFYKTRSLATDAINGGHVHLNGERVKPSRSVKLDDELRIKKGTTELIVHIKGISEQRGPATVAQALYEETDASRARRAQEAEQRRLLAVSAPQRRPDKRARRNIIRFTRGED